MSQGVVGLDRQGQKCGMDKYVVLILTAKGHEAPYVGSSSNKHKDGDKEESITQGNAAAAECVSGCHLGMRG